MYVKGGLLCTLAALCANKLFDFLLRQLLDELLGEFYDLRLDLRPNFYLEILYYFQ